jgi:hypothetical protein
MTYQLCCRIYIVTMRLEVALLAHIKRGFIYSPMNMYQENTLEGLATWLDIHFHAVAPLILEYPFGSYNNCVLIYSST